MVTSITAEELRDRIDAGEELTVVDTRGDESFEGWRIEGAVQYRFHRGDELDAETFSEATGAGFEDAVVTMCAKGRSSAALAETLEAAGFEDAVVVEGGMEAWSAVYDRVTLSFDAFDAIQLQRRAKGCLGYVVCANGEAAVVDATRHTEEFREAAEDAGCEVVRVLDTHVHADHISGGRALASELGVPYHLPARAAERGVEYDYEPLGRNETVDVGGVDLKALFTPGHTTDLASYLVGDEAVLTGDALFVGAVGRTELQFGGNDAAAGAEMLYDSLQGTLLAEPDSVAVLPGHFAVRNDGSADATPGRPVSASVGELRTGLDLLSLDRESFVAAITDRLPKAPPNYARVVAINRGVEEPDDDAEATSLELGPNRCAAEAD